MVTFTCPLCKKLLNADTLAGHTVLTCGHCQGKFDAFSGPQDVVGQYLYNCPYCQAKQVFSERIEGTTLVCSGCKKQFLSGQAVDLRGKVVVTFGCPLCAGKLQIDTLGGKANLSCVHCKGTFDAFNGPQDVDGEYLFNCPLCQIGVITRQLGEAYTCPGCKGVFRHGQVANVRGRVGNQPQPPQTSPAAQQDSLGWSILKKAASVSGAVIGGVLAYSLQQGNKSCFYCRREIPFTAIKCPYCTADLPI